MTARRRLLLGVVGVAATASVVQRDRVGLREISAFRLVNELPDDAFRPLWVVMQGGALGAVPVTALVARTAGRRDLAARMLVGGSSAWLLAKVVKVFVQRPRPVVLLPATRRRGADATGLGYLSGHAAVATTLASAALPLLGPRARVAVLVAVPTIALSRMYVGAHLPLDVLGGAALGIAVDAAVSLLLEPAPVSEVTRSLLP